MTQDVTKEGALAAAIRYFAELPEETRVALGAMGAALPVHAGGDAQKIRFAYRCHHCNGMALVFVGEQFYGANGKPQSDLPLELSIDRIPWMQDLPAELVSRTDPICQSCRSPVALDGRLFRKKFVVAYEAFVASREKMEKAKTELQSRNLHSRLQEAQSIPSAAGSSEYRPLAGMKPSAYLSDENRQTIQAADAAGLLVKDMRKV